jgi:hypothetical protein
MSVRTRMLECNLEDFGLDGLTEFAPSIPQACPLEDLRLCLSALFPVATT